MQQVIVSSDYNLLMLHARLQHVCGARYKTTSLPCTDHTSWQVESQGQMHKLTSGSSIQDKTHYDIISLHTSKHPEHSKCSYMHTMW